jgi:hypothetical protein
MDTTGSFNSPSGSSAHTQPASTPVASSTRASSSTTKKAGTPGRKRTASKSPRTTARTSARGSNTRSSHAPAGKRKTADLFGDYAERAILIPVGAALIASETVTSSVNDMLSTYSSSSKLEAQLRKFERRGGTARKRVERAVRKRRSRVERELRQRRRGLERQRTRVTKDFSTQVEQAQGQVEKTQTWLQDTLKARIDSSQDIAGRLQERVLSQV